MNSCILRAKPSSVSRENQFLNGTASIGWGCNTSFSGLTKEAIGKLLTARYTEMSSVKISLIYTFVQTPIGSLILSPSLSDNKLVHILRTTSGYEYAPEREADGNPNTIQVEHLFTVQRIALPTAVQTSLSGARKTLSKINQHTELLEAFVEHEIEALAGQAPAELLSRDDEDDDAPIVSLNASRAKALANIIATLDSDDEANRLKASELVFLYNL